MSGSPPYHEYRVWAMQWFSVLWLVCEQAVIHVEKAAGVSYWQNISSEENGTHMVGDE